MTNLKVPKGQMGNIFTLHGIKEEQTTHAIGFVLANSPAFLAQFMESVEKETGIRIKDTKDITIELQKHRDDTSKKGYTDIEVGIENNFRVIIEAKRRWYAAGKAQLERYASLLTKEDGEVYFMTISRSETGMHRTIPTPSGKQIPVIHHSWGKIQKLVKQASEQSRKNRNNNELENILLTHLYVHLENDVFREEGEICVVPIGPGRFVPPDSRPDKEDPGYSFQDFVTKGGGYFHPVGGRYPKQLPKHLGFRWHSTLHRIHKVESHSIGQAFSSTGSGELQGGVPMWHDEDKNDHVIYTLEKDNLLLEKIGGGKILPTEVKNAQGQQHWCDFEFLRSEKSLFDAMEKTREKRKRESNERIETAQKDLEEFFKNK